MVSAGAGHGISLLVPFRANRGDLGYDERVRNFEWVRAYWAEHLPLAEFIHGHNEDVPYCKTKAVNEAARRAGGDVVVILDADAYFSPEVLETAAREIRLARLDGRRLWYVPYRRFYRLDAAISAQVTRSDPGNPLVLPDPPPKSMAEELPTYANSDVRAHWYGALVQVMPREAFDAAGGMDERFSGWGSEDVAFMRAVDTLYGPHKTLPRSVSHLYHPRSGTGSANRKWPGQDQANANWPLSRRYLEAKGDPERMAALAGEWRREEPASVPFPVTELRAAPLGQPCGCSAGKGRPGLLRRAWQRAAALISAAAAWAGTLLRLR